MKCIEKSDLIRQIVAINHPELITLLSWNTSLRSYQGPTRTLSGWFEQVRHTHLDAEIDSLDNKQQGGIPKRIPFHSRYL